MIADKIHVLIDGELVEEGIFSELLTKEGYFYTSYIENSYSRQIYEERSNKKVFAIFL